MTKQTKKISMTAYVYYKRPCSWEDDQSGITFSNFDYTPIGLNGKVLMNSQVIQLEVQDDFDPRPKLIEALKEEQRKALADFQKLSTEIMRQISELQALEAS